MNPTLIKYLADLAKWQADVAKYVHDEHLRLGGVNTADSGNNGGGNPPPPPPPPFNDPEPLG